MKRSERMLAADRRALEAAARIAGLVSLGLGLACNGSAGDESSNHAAAQPAPEPATVVEAAPPGEAIETPVTPAPTSKEEELRACQDLTAKAMDDRGKVRSNFDEPAVHACCDKLAKAYDEGMRGEAQGGEFTDLMKWEERSQCCSLLGWRGTMACTPWGPPAPAAYDQHDRAREPASRWSIDWRAEVAAAARELGCAADPELEVFARKTWHGRMINETVSSRVFEVLAAQLERGGFSPVEVRRWAAFADEERLHGQLCGAVVEALGGDARGRSDALAQVPEHADVDARQAALRNVLSVACLSETVAVALIGAEREEMPDGALRELLTQIYRDEIGHARSGWRLLEQVLADEPERREDLRNYLPVALREMIRFELEHIPASGQSPSERWPEGARRWGLCSGERARELLSATVEEVIQPRLDTLLA